MSEKEKLLQILNDKHFEKLLEDRKWSVEFAAIKLFFILFGSWLGISFLLSFFGLHITAIVWFFSWLVSYLLFCFNLSMKTLPIIGLFGTRITNLVEKFIHNKKYHRIQKELLIYFENNAIKERVLNWASQHLDNINYDRVVHLLDNDPSDSTSYLHIKEMLVCFKEKSNQHTVNSTSKLNIKEMW